MKKFLPYGKQSIAKSDINNVIKTLKSDFLTQGPLVENFESKISDYCNVKYVVATNSATSALHIACLALDLQQGDIVWTSAISFVASANCALYCGAKVDFVDIDKSTNNMSVEKLEEKLEQAKNNNLLPKIVIPVHLAGLSCDMKKIHHLSKKYNFKIIEDASHAIGGTYNNERIGNCKFSDITIFSFHPVKIITTAEGGMALTKSSKLAKNLRLLRSHGITKIKSNFKNKSHGDWYYEQQLLGFNYRMNDLEASLGISQLKRIDKFIKKRNKLAQRYNKKLNKLPLQLPMDVEGCLSSFHLYIIIVDTYKSKISHPIIFKELRKANIGVNLHYIPIYKQPFYKKFGFNVDKFPSSEAYYKSAISLPIFPDMTISQQDYVIDKLMKIFLMK